jgi:hypothetical protein
MLPRFGIQTNFIYYENEPFNKKDTLIGTAKQIVISYIRNAPGHPENFGADQILSLARSPIESFIL